MGKKIHPKLLRLNTIYKWNSMWFEEKNYSNYLRNDILISDFIRKKLVDGGVTDINIKRGANETNVDIYSARPGIIIGRGGVGAEELKKSIMNKFFPQELRKKENKHNININIKEVAKPMLSAEFIKQLAAADLEKRIPFKRVIKQMLDKIQKAGALGAKVMVNGRLNGAEIARSEFVSFGSLPLQTIRADIDYAGGIARTTYGTIGIKIWIYKGEIFNKNNKKKDKK